MIDFNEWTEKRHECANMGKVKRLELRWQLYRTSLPVWDSARHFRFGTQKISGRWIFVDTSVPGCQGNKEKWPSIGCPKYPKRVTIQVSVLVEEYRGFNDYDTSVNADMSELGFRLLTRFLYSMLLLGEFL